MAISNVKVLDKALLILSNFFEKDEFSLKELEQKTFLNRSTIYRILQVYMKWGYVDQDRDTKKYRLSIKILEIAGAVLRKINFLDVCRPYLLGLRDETGESAFLAILDREQIIVLDWEPSYYNAHIKVTVGKTVPAYCTAAGRAILAFLQPEDLNAVLSATTLKSYTVNTIADPDILRRELSETAQRGFAVSRGEYDLDIVVVGAPILDIHHRVIASCSIAALESRVKSEEQILRYGQLVMTATQEISRKLGASIESFVTSSRDV